MRALGSVEPHGFDTHYHFPVAAREDFLTSGWADATSTPERDAGFR